MLNRCTDRTLQREELQREVGFYLCHQLTSLHPVRLQARRGGDPVVGKRLPGSTVQRAEGQLCPGAASRQEQEHLGLNMSQKRAQMVRKALDIRKIFFMEKASSTRPGCPGKW